MGRAYYRKELCVLKRVRLDIKTLRQLSTPSQADVQRGHRGTQRGVQGGRTGRVKGGRTGRVQGGRTGRVQGGRTGGLKDPPWVFAVLQYFQKYLLSVESL